MRLLLLGGTEFVGRAVAEAALARGWEVTVFHRGRHSPPDGVRALHGDRTSPDGLAALESGAWDLVVDTWSGAPSAVLATARLLAERVERYAYVSSCSVYTWPPAAGYDEGAPLVEGEPGAGQTAYPQDKRGGELAVESVFGRERSLFLRSGLILGPYENIGRLPWWLGRIARGGAVLAPGPRELTVQYVDVRDLAEFTLDAGAGKLHGAYNVVGPAGRVTMEALLQACVRATGSDADLRWTAPDVVLGAGVEPWTQLPVWVPPGGELHGALHGADVGRAMAAGLWCRDVDVTVEDTWAWLRSLGGVPPQRPDRPAPGLDPAVEAKLLNL
ncbi:NAD-dependent epimerase/dehydratase family protein [Streptomyces sp. NPDC002004]